MPHKRKDLKLIGSNLWYLVGLITSDGCLSPDDRHIDITSASYDFLQWVKDLTGIQNKIGTKYGSRSKKQKAFHIQIANRNFYDFLLSIGLKPKKSSTLGAIMVPYPYFYDFLRGLIDGDGCIRRWIHPTNNKEQWSLRIYTASEKFAKWLYTTIELLLKIKGGIYFDKRSLWTLKYGKMAMRELVKKCYFQHSRGMKRKTKLARECIDSYSGWTKSKTVLNRKNSIAGMLEQVDNTALKAVGA